MLRMLTLANSIPFSLSYYSSSHWPARRQKRTLGPLVPNKEHSAAILGLLERLGVIVMGLMVLVQTQCFHLGWVRNGKAEVFFWVVIIVVRRH